MIVGLGNPGQKYLLTPHNIGWMVLDHLCHHLNSHSNNLPEKKTKGGAKSFLSSLFKRKSPFSKEGTSSPGVLWKTKSASYLYCSVLLNSHKILLLKPLTYMNLSGKAVKEAMAYYKIALEDLLVVQDDTDLPFLSMKFHVNRGAAGHNGIKSIHTELQSQNYARLRVGMQQAVKESPVKRNVLKPFTPEEQNLLPSFLDLATRALVYFIQEGVKKTADHYNKKS